MRYCHFGVSPVNYSDSDGRADKDSYLHDCRADNAPYLHDRRAARADMLHSDSLREKAI